VASRVSEHPTQRLEKQLQKRIAICLESDGWSNDVPTASGLVNTHSRQMNVDLAHTVTDGFELIELKTKSNTPYDAAPQILRYGAIYMLYRLEPELAKRFEFHPILCTKHIVLEVLAPDSYYSRAELVLRSLETQLNSEVETFGNRRAVGVLLSFRLMAFAPDFIFQPSMDCESVCNAVRQRASPFTHIPSTID
jgi:hypothetical protein